MKKKQHMRTNSSQIAVEIDRQTKDSHHRQRAQSDAITITNPKC